MGAITRVLALGVAVTLLVPAFLCGWSPATEKDAQACCRAMQMSCHRSQQSSACCQSKPSTPQLVAVTQPARSDSAAAQPEQTSVLPAATGQAMMRWAYWCTPEVGGHSPPGRVPVFLLNSTLLI